MKEADGMADESPPIHFEDIMTKTGNAVQNLAPLTMPIEEAMRTQRALRRLKPDPVDDALVLRLIELALKAPTGRNAQNWEFVLVKDDMVKARLSRLYRIAWSLYGRIGRHLTAATRRCDVCSMQSSGRWSTSRKPPCWWSRVYGACGRCGHRL